VDAVGVSKTKSLLGLKIENRIRCPTDAKVFKSLMAKTYSTGETATMLLPLHYNNKIYTLRICLRKYGRDHLIMIIPNTIYIRPNPTD
jgi:hypothetical protein